MFVYELLLWLLFTNARDVSFERFSVPTPKPIFKNWLTYCVKPVYCFIAFHPSVCCGNALYSPGCWVPLPQRSLWQLFAFPQSVECRFHSAPCGNSFHSPGVLSAAPTALHAVTLCIPPGCLVPLPQRSLRQRFAFPWCVKYRSHSSPAAPALTGTHDRTVA